MTNVLKEAQGNKIRYLDVNDKDYQPSLAIEDKFVKSKNVRILKIQLGLSCNYACTYCSQRFVKRPDELTKAEIEGFMEKLENLHFSPDRSLKIELWGGEPFVYYKTMIPLVAALKEKFKDWENQPVFSVITNGSILNEEISQWLIDNDFAVSISHDGPGQHVRGPDPLEDLEIRNTIRNLYAILKPKNKISFNSMLNKHNISRKEIHQWFVEFTGDPDVVLGEGGLIDPYDEGGYSESLATAEEHYQFRKVAFNDIRSTGGHIGFMGIIEKIDNFGRRILQNDFNYDMGQKCGMDRPDVIAVDLKGNILTCQNTSHVETAPNGKSHKAGNIQEIEKAKVQSSTHWKDRPNCSTCPVLALCQGSCMYLEGNLWDRACDNAFSDNIVLFALAFEKLTGMIPTYILDPNLPKERQSIWGSAS